MGCQKPDGIDGSGNKEHCAAILDFFNSRLVLTLSDFRGHLSMQHNNPNSMDMSSLSLSAEE